MQIGEEALLTVMVILRMNLEDPVVIPCDVRKELAERGWVELTETGEEIDGHAIYDMHITDEGLLRSDLFAPDIGVDPCPIEEPA